MCVCVCVLCLSLAVAGGLQLGAYCTFQTGRLLHLLDCLDLYAVSQGASDYTRAAVRDAFPMTSICCLLRPAGEDGARYVAQRHAILSVMRRELHRLGVKYTVPVQQQTFTPLVQAPTTPLV